MYWHCFCNTFYSRVMLFSMWCGENRCLLKLLETKGMGGKTGSHIDAARAAWMFKQLVLLIAHPNSHIYLCVIAVLSPAVPTTSLNLCIGFSGLAFNAYCPIPNTEYPWERLPSWDRFQWCQCGQWQDTNKSCDHVSYGNNNIIDSSPTWSTFQLVRLESLPKCTLEESQHDTKIEALPWAVMKSESLDTQLDPNRTAAPPHSKFFHAVYSAAEHQWKVMNTKVIS